MPAPDPGEYRRLSLAAFLDEVAAATPAPGGGSVAAVAAALAAALCSMAARKSPGVPGGSAALTETADARRLRALALASEDAVAYARVLDARRAAVAGGEPGLGLPLLEAALSAAAEVPMELAGLAAEISGVASDLVVSGNVNLVGDSLAAALLASGAAEAAAALVAINLAAAGGGPTGDRRAGRACELAAEAGAAAGRARAAAERRLGGS